MMKGQAKFTDPLFDPFWYFPSGAGRKISTPGAAIAIWAPRFDATNSLSWASVALTAITLGLAAG